MRSAAFVLSVGAIALTTARANADEPARKTDGAAVNADANAYCDWVSGAATSQSAPLVAPSVFVGGGVVNGLEAGDGASALPPTGRVTAGLTYSITGLVRGVAIQNRADADCERYRMLSRIHAFVQSYSDGESRKALGARLKVLETALPRLDEMQKRVEGQLRDGRATIEEATSVLLRADDLRAQIGRAKREVDARADRAAPSLEHVAEDLKAVADAEAEVERREASVRKSNAWDLTLRGGYDRFFGVRDHLPLFGMAMLSVSLGALAQPSADDRAVEGRRAWAGHQVQGTVDRARQALATLRAVYAEARQRLATREPLIAQLEQRQKTLESFGRDSTRTQADALWFEVVKARAEQAYLEAVIAELEPIVGARKPADKPKR